MKSLVLERIHPPISIQRNSYERHWALTKVIIKITIFWVTIPCNLVNIYGCFRLQILHHSPSYSSHKSNTSSVPQGIVDSYSTLPWVTWEAVTVVEGTP